MHLHQLNGHAHGVHRTKVWKPFILLHGRYELACTHRVANSPSRSGQFGVEATAG